MAASELDAPKSGSGGSFHHAYRLSHVLAKGSNARVYLASSMTNHSTAVKIYFKKSCKLNAVRSEIKILKLLNHSNIVGYEESFEDASNVFICMELLQGKDLAQFLGVVRRYDEDLVRGLVKQLLLGLDHCHRKDIIHRDVKPENIMFSSDQSPCLKLIDFGFAIQTTEPVTEFVGTPAFLPPEIYLVKPYDTSLDMWAVGVLTYILLSGSAPFRGRRVVDVVASICRGDFSFAYADNAVIWEKVSSGGKKFVQNLLLVDADKRLTTRQALKHPWIVGKKHQSTNLDKVIQPLQRFNSELWHSGPQVAKIKSAWVKYRNRQRIGSCATTSTSTTPTAKTITTSVVATEASETIVDNSSSTLLKAITSGGINGLAVERGVDELSTDQPQHSRRERRPISPFSKRCRELQQLEPLGQCSMLTRSAAATTTTRPIAGGGPRRESRLRVKTLNASKNRREEFPK